MFNFVKQYNISCVCTYLLCVCYHVNLYSVICFNLMFLLGKPFESPQGKLACYQNNGGSNISKHEIGKLWRNFFPIVHLFRLGGGGGGIMPAKSSREIMPAKYGWLHMGDSVEFSYAFRFRSE